MPPWNAPKAKVQLRLAVQRLRTLQEKKEAQAKASRRDIATLLERGKLETARIKVENIINEDIYLELLELMELYCELLIARFGILDQNTREPDPAVNEGVCAVIYAALRTEVKELHILRDLLMHKYGREFSLAVSENQDGCVSERVAKKLVVVTPSTQLVDAYLEEIAKGYGVPWTAPRAVGDDAVDDAPDGGAKEASGDPSQDGITRGLPVHATAAAEGKAGAGPAVLKLPDLPPAEDEPSRKGTPTGPPAKASAPAPPVDDFEALRQRFSALKKR